MSSNFSLSSISHRPLNAAGPQQDSSADTSSKIPGLFDDVQFSPSIPAPTLNQRYKSSNQINWDDDDGISWIQEVEAQADTQNCSQIPRGSKALENKSWLVAAMVLGLMASYPLILKPTCQAA